MPNAMLRRTLLSRAAALVAAGIAGGPALEVAAHAYHASLAEIELNQRTGSLEVALRLIPEDLARALSRAAGRRVDLDRVAEAAPVAASYLRQKFLVTLQTPSAGRPVAPRWLGMEVSVKEAWLYMEFSLPSTARQVLLVNRVLFELEKQQLNTVDARTAKGRSSFVFRRGDAPKTLVLR